MKMLRAVLITLVVLSGALCEGQRCPPEPPDGGKSEVRTLEGKLFYNSGVVEEWFDLQLDRSECGDRDFAAVMKSHPWTALEVLRGCRVRVNGWIETCDMHCDASPNYFFVVEAIEPVGQCVRKRLLPDYSKLKPSKTIRRYRVVMRIDNRGDNPPITFRVTSGGKVLRPWQVYAGASIQQAGEALYANCAEGFNAEGDEGYASFSLVGAGAYKNRNLVLGYTCVRERSERR